jgi:hypothetical protein
VIGKLARNFSNDWKTVAVEGDPSDFRITVCRKMSLVGPRTYGNGKHARAEMRDCEENNSIARGRMKLGVFVKRSLLFPKRA